DNTLFVLGYAIPAEFSVLGVGYHGTLSSKLKDSAPLKSLSGGVKPFFEEIGELVRKRYQIPPQRDIRCDQTPYECRTAAVFFHYAEGVDFWGTPHASNLFDVVGALFKPRDITPKVMDEAPAGRAKDFINEYFSTRNPDGKRKRFPAVFAIYFSGLDHYAHDQGMEGYSEYFRKTTDQQIREVVNALKSHGEFDNKIFLIVSDHGMTEMPDPRQMTLEERDEDGNLVKIWYGDASCELKLGGFGNKKIQYPELANNNLHIWELAEVLKSMPLGKDIVSGKKVYHKILAPIEIVKASKGETTTRDPKEAEIIAAFNGPMAHLYFISEG
ncbi:MAG: alkaline phosphatase family protein, partial [Syntrophales bacterium]|nr:alkaline phosphatase family protein [Syntrophales bacterium]